MLSLTRRAELVQEVATLETQWEQLRETLKQCQMVSHDTTLHQSERAIAHYRIGSIQIDIIRLARRIDDVQWLLA